MSHHAETTDETLLEVHEVQAHSSEASHGEGHGSSSPVDGAMFFWFLVIFITATVILKKKAFTPILEKLDEREKEIEQSLENADRLEKEMAELESTVQAKKDEADAEAREILDSGREAAREAAKVIESKARDDAAILRENAERDISTAQGKAEAALREHSAAAAVDLAMKLLNRELDSKGKKELADQLIAEM